MTKFNFFLSFIGIISVLIFGFLSLKFLQGSEVDSEPETNILVVTTGENLAYFVRVLAADVPGVQVKSIISGNVEPHDFEPTAKDIILATEKADLFLAVGGGFDIWAESILLDRTRQSKLVASFVDSKEIDPHFWLDPVLLSEKIIKIGELLAAADQSNAQIYLDNAKKYQEKLSILHEAYKAGLLTCDLREIIVTHNAFSLLAKRYDIFVHSILGAGHDDEPSINELAGLVDLAKNKGIKTIFYEQNEASGVAQVLAMELGAQMAVLDSFEFISEPSTVNYLSIMDNNLQALRQAMLCR